MEQYTKLEQEVISHFHIAFNYDNAHDEKEDNATCINVLDIANDTELSINTVKGVFGSLCKKGVIEPWDEADMQSEHFITEKGIDAHYSIV